MTFSASSIEAWCRYVVLVTTPSEVLLLIASRFQFARPAVELSFLLQMMRIDLVGDLNLGLEGLVGGVIKRTVSELFRNGFDDRGELHNDEYC